MLTGTAWASPQWPSLHETEIWYILNKQDGILNSSCAGLSMKVSKEQIYSKWKKAHEIKE